MSATKIWLVSWWSQHRHSLLPHGDRMLGPFVLILQKQCVVLGYSIKWLFTESLMFRVFPCLVILECPWKGGCHRCWAPFLGQPLSLRNQVSHLGPHVYQVGLLPPEPPASCFVLPPFSIFVFSSVSRPQTSTQQRRDSNTVSKYSLCEWIVHQRNDPSFGLEKKKNTETGLLAQSLIAKARKPKKTS